MGWGSASDMLGPPSRLESNRRLPVFVSVHQRMHARSFSGQNAPPCQLLPSMPLLAPRLPEPYRAAFHLGMTCGIVTPSAERGSRIDGGSIWLGGHRSKGYGLAPCPGFGRGEHREPTRRVEKQFSTDLGRIFRAHEMMLEGMLSSPEFRQELQASLINAEAAARRVFRRWHEQFRSLKDESFRQRADDIADVGRKVLRHLEGEDTDRLKHLPAGCVLVLRRLLPSDVVSLSRRHVAAIVVESLGQGSHAALLAREKSIPTVANFPGLLERLRDGDELLVDASRGEIVLAPVVDMP